MAAAYAAGNHAVKEFDRRTEVIQRTQHDVKLVLDREAQDQAEESIRAFFPDHNIIGEEG